MADAQARGAMADGTGARPHSGAMSAQPTPSLPARWHGVLDLALVRDVLLIVVVSRLALVALTLLVLRLTAPGSALSATGALKLWDHWDATLYWHIALDGYAPAHPGSHAAFFPLFPLLEHLLGGPLAGNYLLAGLLLSNAAFAVAMLGVAALAALDFDHGTARRAVLYYTIFPTAFFFFAGYPEALFLACACWSFYAMRRHQWLLAGLLGLLASATRQAGVLLLVPFVWEYAAQHSWRPRTWRWDVAWGALIPLGLLSYMAYFWVNGGNPQAFLVAEQTYGRVTALPVVTLVLGVGALFDQPSHLFLARAVQELVTVGVFLGLTVLAFRTMRRSYALFAAITLCAMLTQLYPPWPLLSQSRFVLELFPLFLLLGWYGRSRRVHLVVLAVGIPLTVLLTQFFLRGGWIL